MNYRIHNSNGRKPVVTGMSRVDSARLDDVLANFQDRIRVHRYFHTLDKLVIAAVGLLLDDAGIRFPVQTDEIGLYLGIDDAVEGLKDEYFKNIIREGLLGASPSLFPLTSPNALSALASIAFDLRGESITFSIRDSCQDVIDYALECLMSGHTKMAIAGAVLLDEPGAIPSQKAGRITTDGSGRILLDRGKKIPAEKSQETLLDKAENVLPYKDAPVLPDETGNIRGGRYKAEFLFLESGESARERGVRMLAITNVIDETLFR